MSESPIDAWTRPTTGFWQQLGTATAWEGRMGPPFRYGYPALLPDGRILELPIRRRRDDPARAVASLIANQASFAVVEALSVSMAAAAARLDPAFIVGLPTLGMVFAGPVARTLGHDRWVPLGYSRKFWYDDALSVPVSSLTTPTPGKRVYLDPNQVDLLVRRPVVIVDDAVSSGETLRRSWDLLEGIGAQVAGAVVAMRQGSRWRAALGPERAGNLLGVFDSPLLQLREDGWWPEGSP